MTIKSFTFSSPKKIWVITLAVLMLAVPMVSFAVPSWEEVLGNIIYWVLFWPFVLIMQLEMWLLPIVAQYSDFVREEKVVETWKILRDLANMFFIVILLIMSFGTILQLKGYGYKNMLSGILLMAILVNFSRTIIGLAVDFAQIIMLTFVAAWKDVAAGSFQNSLGLYNTLNLKEGNGEGGDITWADFISAVFLGGIMMIVAVVLIGIFIVMLVMRIVTLWILTILSPMAFLANAYPQTKKYYNEWEQELTKNLIIGPALAFFLWLTFTITGDGTISKKIVKQDQIDAFSSSSLNAGGRGATTAGSAIGGPTKGTTVDSFLNYIVAIALLASGLKFASQSGAAGAGVARSGLGKLEGYVSKANKMASAKTVGRVEGLYTKQGVIGGTGVRLANRVGSTWVDDKGRLKKAPEGAGWVRKTFGGQYIRQGVNALTLGGAQRTAIRTRMARQQRIKDITKSKQAEGLPAGMQAAYLESKLGSGGVVSRAARFLGAPLAGLDRDLEPALMKNKLDNNNLQGNTEADSAERRKAANAFIKAGDRESLKKLHEAYPDILTETEAKDLVGEKRENALTGFKPDGIINDKGQPTDGFAEVVKNLLDPLNGIAYTEIIAAIGKMNKASQKAIKKAMKEMGADLSQVAADGLDIVKRREDGSLVKTVDGQPQWDINGDSGLVKFMSVAGFNNPAAISKVIDSVVDKALTQAKNDEEKNLINDDEHGLRQALWNNAIKKADYSGLLGDLPNWAEEGSADQAAFAEYAKRASNAQQKQFYESATTNTDVLLKFAQAIEDSGGAVNSILLTTLEKAGKYTKKGEAARARKSTKSEEPEEESGETTT